VHFIGFDPTQPLQEPGHYGTSNLQWLTKDLRRVPHGTPTVLFQHFPMGDNFYYVDDQDRFLDLVAGYAVRGIFAGHIHQDQVRQLNGMTEVALDAVRNSAMYYWAEKSVDAHGAASLTVSRVDVAADGSETRRTVATVALSTPGPGGDQRPTSVDLGRVRDGKLPVTVTTARRAGTGAVQCHAYPQQLFGGAVVGTWTGLTEAAPGRWTGSLDVSALAPGVQRLQLRALDADGNGWERTERFEIPLRSRTPAPAAGFQLGGAVQGGVAALGDSVVAVSTSGDVVALGTDRHGELRRDWHTTVGPVFRRPGVAADARTVYVSSTDHSLYALDARDGRRRWTYRTDAPALSSPLVARIGGHETVFLGAGHTLHAVAADSGRRRWTVEGHGFFAGRAATDGTRLFTGGGDGFVRAFDAATGAALWSVDVTGGNENHRLLYGPWDDTLLAGAGVVLVSTVSNTTAYDAATGAKRWTVAGSAMYAPKLALPGAPSDALLITEFGVLTRVDMVTGAVRWTTPTNVRCLNSGATTHGESVWVQSVDGQLIGVDLTTGTVTARLQHSLAFCFSTPAALGDFVVSGDQNGVVGAIRVA
jgi:outer membrane protein assembly factor BamB